MFGFFLVEPRRLQSNGVSLLFKIAAVDRDSRFVHKDVTGLPPSSFGAYANLRTKHYRHDLPVFANLGADNPLGLGQR
jgi:hypothetical protein